MKESLTSVPDCTLSRYRLQLNVYRYIIESYYECEVSRMFVVGCNPDNRVVYVDPVPCMTQETAALMNILRVDVCGGSAWSLADAKSREL